jgi:hypothetical protein
MNNEKAHASLPFVVNGFGGDFKVVLRLEPSGVAISTSGELGDAIETARFIVNACNSHEQLVEALKRAESFLLERYGHADAQYDAEALSVLAALAASSPEVRS